MTTQVKKRKVMWYLFYRISARLGRIFEVFKCLILKISLEGLTFNIKEKVGIFYFHSMDTLKRPLQIILNFLVLNLIVHNRIFG